MSPLRRFGRFWYDFVVGDDWRLAAGVAALLILTFAVSKLSVPAWWSLPAGVMLLLPHSVLRAVRVKTRR